MPFTVFTVRVRDILGGYGASKERERKILHEKFREIEAQKYHRFKHFQTCCFYNFLNAIIISRDSYVKFNRIIFFTDIKNIFNT